LQSRADAVFSQIVPEDSSQSNSENDYDNDYDLPFLKNGLRSNGCWQIGVDRLDRARLISATNGAHSGALFKNNQA
jgi:hypothetical protein